MDMPMEQVSEWIRAQTNPTFTIRKQESQDIDEVRMRIDRIEVARNPYADVDDYVSKQALLLRGQGRFVSTIDAPLPDDTYEIALAEPYSIQEEGPTLRIMTNRATYTLTPHAAGAGMVH